MDPATFNPRADGPRRHVGERRDFFGMQPIHVDATRFTHAMSRHELTSRRSTSPVSQPAEMIPCRGIPSPERLLLARIVRVHRPGADACLPNEEPPGIWYRQTPRPRKAQIPVQTARRDGAWHWPACLTMWRTHENPPYRRTAADVAHPVAGLASGTPNDGQQASRAPRRGAVG
jgi:hypothetical protein